MLYLSIQYCNPEEVIVNYNAIDLKNYGQYLEYNIIVIVVLKWLLILLVYSGNITLYSQQDITTNQCKPWALLQKADRHIYAFLLHFQKIFQA